VSSGGGPAILFIFFVFFFRSRTYATAASSPRPRQTAESDDFSLYFSLLFPDELPGESQSEIVSGQYRDRSRCPLAPGRFGRSTLLFSFVRREQVTYMPTRFWIVRAMPTYRFHREDYTKRIRSRTFAILSNT